MKAQICESNIILGYIFPNVVSYLLQIKCTSDFNKRKLKHSKTRIKLKKYILLFKKMSTIDLQDFKQVVRFEYINVAKESKKYLPGHVSGACNYLIIIKKPTAGKVTGMSR